MIRNSDFMSKLNRSSYSQRLGNDGSAVVEATFLFPVMFMIFFALVLLAFYLPQRAALQRATQFAATAIATEMSDSWIDYNETDQSFGRYNSYDALRIGKGGIYETLFKSVFASGINGAETTVISLDSRENPPVIENGELKVKCELVNYVIYKEISVTATRSIKVPVDFSLIKFPDTVDITVSSKAVVLNGDEFIRNVDLAASFIKYLGDKYESVGVIFDKVEKAGNKISSLFGI